MYILDNILFICILVENEKNFFPIFSLYVSPFLITFKEFTWIFCLSLTYFSLCYTLLFSFIFQSPSPSLLHPFFLFYFITDHSTNLFFFLSSFQFSLHSSLSPPIPSKCDADKSRMEGRRSLMGHVGRDVDAYQKRLELIRPRRPFRDWPLAPINVAVDRSPPPPPCLSGF